MRHPPPESSDRAVARVPRRAPEDQAEVLVHDAVLEPALPADFPALAQFFIKKYAAELKKKVEGLTPDANKLLLRYNFPGNIRELENTIERAALLADSRFIEADDLRLGEAASSGDGLGAAVVKLPPTGIALEEIERQALVEALRMSNWVQKDAAELLHISPRVMNYKIKVLGIELPRSRRAAAAVAEAVAGA